jgi:hypothetical protein
MNINHNKQSGKKKKAASYLKYQLYDIRNKKDNTSQETVRLTLNDNTCQTIAKIICLLFVEPPLFLSDLVYFGLVTNM